MSAPEPSAVIAYVQDGDVLFLDWPDGKETMVKGRDTLDAIIRSGQTKELCVARLPVSTERGAEMIAALVGVIAKGQFHLGAEAAFCKMLVEARE